MKTICRRKDDREIVIADTSDNALPVEDEVQFNKLGLEKLLYIIPKTEGDRKLVQLMQEDTEIRDAIHGLIKEVFQIGREVEFCDENGINIDIMRRLGMGRYRPKRVVRGTEPLENAK
jgi:hypothetical protein